MTKLFRAVLIDPEQCSVASIQTNASLQSLCELMGTIWIDSFRLAEHSSGFDYAWVDDLGLARGKPVHAFLLDIRRDPVAGRCVIVGVDHKTKETTDATLPVDFLREHIQWLGQIMPEVTWDQTDTGSRAIVTYARVKT